MLNKVLRRLLVPAYAVALYGGCLTGAAFADPGDCVPDDEDDISCTLGYNLTEQCLWCEDSFGYIGGCYYDKGDQAETSNNANSMCSE